MDLEQPHEARMLAMFCHLLLLAGSIIPLSNYIGILVIWMAKGRTSEFIVQNAMAALNFQVSITLILLLCFYLNILFIGFAVAFFIGIYALFEVVIASIKANQGQLHRYRFSIRFVQ